MSYNAKTNEMVWYVCLICKTQCALVSLLREHIWTEHKIIPQRLPLKAFYARQTEIVESAPYTGYSAGSSSNRPRNRR